MLRKMLLAIITILITMECGYAQPQQDLNVLIGLAKKHIEKVLREQYGENSDIQVSAGHVDQRLRLNACQTTPRTDVDFGQIGQKNMMVKISCEAPLHWAIRIPIHVEHFNHIIVTQKRIAKDAIITEDDLTMLRKDITQLPPGYYDNMNEIVGQVAKNEIQYGVVIKSNMVKQKILVKRGSLIKILVKGPGITVESNGVAQNDGAKNELIKVKNAKSNKIIEGTVEEYGIVAVYL